MNIHHVYIILFDQKRNQTVGLTLTESYQIAQGSLIQFLKKVCLQYGSTLDGRLEAFIKNIPNHKKKPILIHSSLIFFPTFSLKNKQCILLNYTLIEKIKSINANQTMIYFQFGKTFSVDVNYRIIQRQMKLCQRYLDIIKSNPFQVNVNEINS